MNICLHVIYFQAFIHISVNIIIKVIICLLLNISMNDHDKIFCDKEF